MTSVSCQIPIGLRRKQQIEPVDFLQRTPSARSETSRVRDAGERLRSVGGERKFAERRKRVGRVARIRRRERRAADSIRTFRFSLVFFYMFIDNQ